MKQLRKWTVAAFCSLAGGLYAQTPSYSTYQVNKDLTNLTDWKASSLSKNFKDKHLKGMESQLMKQLAEKMLRGDYNSAYLLQSYKPIPSNKVLEQQLKLTNGYSRYENITGVYLEAGESIGGCPSRTHRRTAHSRLDASTDSRLSTDKRPRRMGSEKTRDTVTRRCERNQCEESRQCVCRLFRG